jgi:hypothetical protein
MASAAKSLLAAYILVHGMSDNTHRLSSASSAEIWEFIKPHLSIDFITLMINVES